MPTPTSDTLEKIRRKNAIVGVVGLGYVGLPLCRVFCDCGMRVLGISCVTNAAAGILDKPLDSKEVLETAGRVKGQFIAVLEAVILRIAEAIA